ncbi:MAG: hypothetical protein CL957_03150 [Euryarchaeota archaeon]|nr:hypothetical protein [Euryarchaeota archaeon]
MAEKTSRPPEEEKISWAEGFYADSPGDLSNFGSCAATFGGALRGTLDTPPLAKGLWSIYFLLKRVDGP